MPSSEHRELTAYALLEIVAHPEKYRKIVDDITKRTAIAVGAEGKAIKAADEVAVAKEQLARRRSDLAEGERVADAIQTKLNAQTVRQNERKARLDEEAAANRARVAETEHQRAGVESDTKRLEEQTSDIDAQRLSLSNYLAGLDIRRDAIEAREKRVDERVAAIRALEGT